MQDEMTEEEQKQLLLQYTDQLRLSMAGNLQDYQTENCKVGVWHVLPMFTWHMAFHAHCLQDMDHEKVCQTYEQLVRDGS